MDSKHYLLDIPAQNKERYYQEYTSSVYVNLNSPQGYKQIFMLNSTEHEISTTHKIWNTDKRGVSGVKSLRCCIYHADKC